MAYVIADKPAGFDPFAKQGKKEKTYYVSDTPVDFDPFSQSRTKTQEMDPQSTTGQGTIQNQPIEQQTQPTQELKPTEPRNAVDVPPPAVARALSGRSQEDEERKRKIEERYTGHSAVRNEVRNVLRPDYEEPYLLATPSFPEGWDIVRARVERLKGQKEGRNLPSTDAELQSLGLPSFDVIFSKGQRLDTLNMRINERYQQLMKDKGVKRKFKSKSEREKYALASAMSMYPVSQDLSMTDIEQQIYEKYKPALAGWGRLPNETAEQQLSRQIRMDENEQRLKSYREGYSAALEWNSPEDLKHFGDLIRKAEDDMPSFEREAQQHQAEAEKLAEQIPAFIVIGSVIGANATVAKIAERMKAVPGLRRLVPSLERLSKTKVAPVIDRALTGAASMGTVGAVSQPDDPVQGATHGAAFGGSLGLFSFNPLAGATAMTILNAAHRIDAGEDPETAVPKAAIDTVFILAMFRGAHTEPRNNEQRNKWVDNALSTTREIGRSAIESKQAFIKEMAARARKGDQAAKEWLLNNVVLGRTHSQPQPSPATRTEGVPPAAAEQPQPSSATRPKSVPPAEGVGAAVSGKGAARLGDRVKQNKAQQATELAAADRAAREAMRPQNAQMVQAEAAAQDNAPRLAGGEKKPKELMTAAEFEADRKRQQKELGHGEHIPGTIGSKKAIAVESSYGPLKRALEDGRPVNADLFDVHNSDPDNRPVLLPDGYVREGDYYVKKQPAEQSAPAPKLVPVDGDPFAGVDEVAPAPEARVEDGRLREDIAEQEAAPANTTTTPVKANEKKTVEPVRSSIGSLSHKVGDIVTWREPAIVYEGGNPITIQAKKAGTIKEILPDGRYDIRRQDGGYQKATDSDLLPKLSGSNTQTKITAGEQAQRPETVRSSTITLQNKAGKTRTVDVVKETDTAFLYRDEDGKQRRLMKTAWTKQTEQQVAKTNSKVEIDKEKNESTSNKSIKTNQTKDVPLSGSESPQSYRQRSEETIRKEIETNGLGGEFENFLARLESAKGTARNGSYGLQAQKDDQGYITGWYNQGKIYPEGFDAKSIPAIRNFIRGKRPLTQNQLDVVERAYELIEAEIGIKLEVVKYFKEDIKKGERPPQEVIDENPSEWEIAISESGINEDDLGDTSFDFGFSVVDKNEDAQVDSLKEWRKNHGIAEPDEQVEMFGKGAVGDVFELQSQVVKERESFSEKKAREEKQAKAEAAQTNMFEPSPEQAINRQETIDQSAPKGKESKLSFLDKTQNKPRGVSSGNALGTGGGAGIDTFKPDVEQHGQKEVKLYERSKELIKKHGGNRKIMEGRNPSGTLGVSYSHSGNIALAALNNIGVAVHETTHNVDRKIRFTERITRTVGTTKDGKPKYDPATRKERKELTEVYTEFYPNGNATHSLKKRVTEGFATFVQKYIEDPTTMSKRFPELKNMILDPSGKYYSPEVEALIKDARAIVNDYHKLDPLQKIGARILQGKSKDGKPFLNFKDKVETIVADQVWPLEKMSKEAGVHFTEEDVSLYARSYDYLSSIIAHNLKKNAFGAESFMTFKDGKFVEIYDFNYRTLIRGLHKTGLDKTFDEYLVARRKVADYKKLDTLKDEMDKASKSVKNAVNIAKEMGIKPKEVVVGNKSMADLVNEFKKAKKEHDNHKSIIDKDNLSRDLVQQAVNLANDTIPDIKTYEEMHDKLTRADLNLLKEVGIISSKDYNDYVSEPGYASFKRDMFNDLIDPKTGKTTSVANLSGGSVSSLKRRTGSERTIISPTANAVANHAEIMRKAFRQATLNKLADLADKVPDLMQKEKLRRIYDPDTGKTIYPQENDPNIIMARRDGERIPYVINKEIKTVLDRILTPESVDIGEKIGAAFSRLFTKGTTGLWIAFAGQNVMVDSLAASAQSRTEYVPIVSQLKLIYKAIRGNSSKEAEFLREYMIIVGARQTATGWNELPPDKLKQVISKEVSALGIVAKAYFLGEKILGAPTQASEILTRATEYINSRVNGDSQFVAMEKAGRVSAPFHHHGSYGGHRSIRALVRGTPYLNSGIQAPKEYWKALLDPKRVNRALLVTSLVVGAKILELVPMMIAATDDQKKKLKDIPTKYAARYIFIPHPNGIDLIKVRIPETMGTIGTLINMELQNRMMENDYSASEFVDAGTAWVPDQFNITSPRRMALSWITGFQATKPLVENILNKKTWPDVRDLESIGVSYDRPEDRIYRNTSELAKNISKMKVLGKSIGERTGLSPIKVDNLIEGYFARIATLFTKPSMAIRKNITPFEMEVYFTAGRSVQDFYDQADAVTQMRNAISDGKEKVTPEQARIIESDYQKVLSVKRGLKEYNDLGDERTKEAEILRAKIIDTMDSLGTGDEYKEYFPTKKSFKPKLIEPYSTKEKTPFDTDRKSSREPTPFDNR